MVAALWPGRAGTRRAYSAALGQRNALISGIRAGRAGRGSLPAWDAELARHGIALMRDRAEAVDRLRPRFVTHAEDVGLEGEPSSRTARARRRRTPTRSPRSSPSASTATSSAASPATGRTATTLRSAGRAASCAPTARVGSSGSGCWHCCSPSGRVGAERGAPPLMLLDVYVADAIARNAVVWDVRAADAYAQGHIAGAISIGDAAKVLRDDNTEDFIATDRIEKILGAAGLDPTREIIVYGSRGTWNPYFGLYTLQYFGGSNMRVYHEGIEDWAAAGRAISRDASQIPPVTLKLQINPTVAVTTKEMVALLNNSNVQIVDVRTPREFIGEDIRAIRGGHIPGAINIPYEQNWIDPETPAKLARKQVTNNAGMSLKPSEELKRLYARLDPSKETIVYCQSGARASETAGVLQQLGFTNVKVYDLAWLGYGNTLDAPANNVTFFNVGLLNSRLLALQDRVNQLERELAEAKARK